MATLQTSNLPGSSVEWGAIAKFEARLVVATNLEIGTSYLLVAV